MRSPSIALSCSWACPDLGDRGTDPQGSLAVGTRQGSARARSVCCRDRQVRGPGPGPQERPHHPGVPEPGAGPGGSRGDPGGHRQPRGAAAAAGHQLADLRARLRPGRAAGGEAAGRAGEQRRPHWYAPGSGSGVCHPRPVPGWGPAPRPAAAGDACLAPGPTAPRAPLFQGCPLPSRRRGWSRPSPPTTWARSCSPTCCWVSAAAAGAGGALGTPPCSPPAPRRPPEGVGARPHRQRLVLPAQRGHRRRPLPHRAGVAWQLCRRLRQHQADERPLHRRAGAAPAGHRWVPG